MGGRRGRARPRARRVHRPRQGARDRPRRQALHRARHPPVRAVAAAHPGDLPGGRVAARASRFAAENAEAIFVAAPTKAMLRETVSTIRRELELAGRDRTRRRSSRCSTVITAATDEEARPSTTSICRTADPEGALVFMSGWMGVDLSRYDLDEPIGNVDSNAIQSAVKAFQSADRTAASGPCATSPSGARSAAWARSSSAPAAAWPTSCRSGSRRPTSTASTWPMRSRRASFDDFVEHVVPVLTERGAYQSDYAPGSLRNKLLGSGDRLPDEHRGARYRVGGPDSTIIERPSTVPSSSASAAAQPATGR